MEEVVSLLPKSLIAPRIQGKRLQYFLSITAMIARSFNKQAEIVMLWVKPPLVTLASTIRAPVKSPSCSLGDPAPC